MSELAELVNERNDEAGTIIKAEGNVMLYLKLHSPRVVNEDAIGDVCVFGGLITSARSTPQHVAMMSRDKQYAVVNGYTKLIAITMRKHCNGIIESPLADKRAIVVLDINSFTSFIYKHVIMIYNHNLTSITLEQIVEDEYQHQPLFNSASDFVSKHKTNLAERSSKTIVGHLRRVVVNSQSQYVIKIWCWIDLITTSYFQQFDRGRTIETHPNGTFSASKRMDTNNVQKVTPWNLVTPTIEQELGRSINIQQNELYMLGHPWLSLWNTISPLLSLTQIRSAMGCSVVVPSASVSTTITKTVSLSAPR